MMVLFGAVVGAVVGALIAVGGIAYNEATKDDIHLTGSEVKTFVAEILLNDYEIRNGRPPLRLYWPQTIPYIQWWNESSVKESPTHNP